ncbi:MAG: type II toxin-antitoxin system RelE/ParE family toxin [Desulfamplus sp.]|nr:type II toxin-antitoxin system RelE/ParE family toxin [Desulfamplus sp.]
MYQIKLTPTFNRRIKKLAKKYQNIKSDFAELLEDLEQGNFKGDELQGFSGKVYKVRIASGDQQKGKSGGFRFIYYVVTKEQCVYLMTAYAKSSQTDLTNEQRKQIKDFIETI